MKKWLVAQWDRHTGKHVMNSTLFDKEEDAEALLRGLQNCETATDKVKCLAYMTDEAWHRTRVIEKPEDTKVNLDISKEWANSPVRYQEIPRGAFAAHDFEWMRNAMSLKRSDGGLSYSTFGRMPIMNVGDSSGESTKYLR